jgi:predicted phosphodiesterase
VKFDEFLASFRELIAASPEEELAPGARYVIVSDLHMGDGSSRDDLEKNRGLIMAVLRDWYFARGFTLILAGDVEDLYKFDMPLIRRAWEELYALFDAFDGLGRLRKLVGNHDLALLREREGPYRLLEGLSLLYGTRRLFCFHGHQASRFFSRYNDVSDFLVRYVAKPLHYRNPSASNDSRQRFKAERRIYRASKGLGMVSIAGHTHRPLFESLSKYDSLRFAMEGLVQDYPGADAAGRREIEERVRVYRAEFERLRKKERGGFLARGLYEELDFVIPCVFNAGCATRDGAMTAIEVVGPSPADAVPAAAAADQARGASIALVHWAAQGSAKAYIEKEALEAYALPRGDGAGGPWVRYVIRRDALDSVFARIDLLGGQPPA